MPSSKRMQAKRDPVEFKTNQRITPASTSTYQLDSNLLLSVDVGTCQKHPNKNWAFPINHYNCLLRDPSQDNNTSAHSPHAKRATSFLIPHPNNAQFQELRLPEAQTLLRDYHSHFSSPIHQKAPQFKTLAAKKPKPLGHLENDRPGNLSFPPSPPPESSRGS